MSRDKKYPRTIESKNSYLRIRAPEHLDVALEGLIRKVLKEQPKMDDIYAFAADYFDMLLQLREKSGIRKVSIQDICPHHNEEDAKEMIKLASTFTKRKKEPKSTSRTYRAVSLKHGDHRNDRKGPKTKDGRLKAPKNGEKFNTLLPIVNEHPEFEEAKSAEIFVKSDKPESQEKESEIYLMVRPTSQDTSEKIIEAREVILEEDGEEEENTEESGIATVGDINEIRDKIKVVENEIKWLEKRESEMSEEPTKTVETAEEIKSEVEDGDTEEAIPSIKESEDATPSAENEITIEEATLDIEGKREEEQEMGNETAAQECEAKGDIEVQETKEVQELYVKAEEMKENKNDETATEGTRDSGTEQTEEQNTVEEIVPEESLNDEAAVQETQESKPGAVEEQMQEPGGVEETLQEKADDEVVHEAEEADTQQVKAAPNISEAAEESAQTEASTGDFEETKADRSSAVEEMLDTITKESTETECTEEVNPDDSIVEETRSIDPAQAKETKLMGGDETKDEKAENEEFLKFEKQSEEVHNDEPTSVADDAEKTTEDYTVVITVPGNVEEENKQAEGEANALVAVAGELEAVAAVLQHAKKKLTDPKLKEVEADQKPSKEELLMENEPEKQEMTLTQQVQKFLDRERQLSGYDMKMEELIKAGTPGIVGEIAPGILVSMKPSENEEPAEKAQPGPRDAEAEGGDHEREGSTTSGEMEFEISPFKQATAEVETDILAVEGKTGAIPEPQIVLELNRSESEEKTAFEEPEAEPMKVFLSVPATVEEEYPARDSKEIPQNGPTKSKRSLDEEPEVILDCSNVENELIQTGEVQKVELIEGEEDILQVHLTTTIDTVQENRESLLVQMTSKIDPTFEVCMETKVESPVLDEKVRLVRAAVVIQNGFRRFRKRKVLAEALDVPTDELDSSETKLDLSMQTFLKDISSRESDSSFSSSATKINNFKGRNFSRSTTRTLLETHSLDPIRKITPLKTRSLSSVRYGVADFEVWNQLVKELEKAATKIQSNYRGYKTRKKLQRENAIQSTTMTMTTTTTTTTTSEDLTATAEISHRHTGEFHDSIVLPLPPE